MISIQKGLAQFSCLVWTMKDNCIHIIWKCILFYWIISEHSKFNTAVTLSDNLYSHGTLEITTRQCHNQKISFQTYEYKTNLASFWVLKEGYLDFKRFKNKLLLHLHRIKGGDINRKSNRFYSRYWKWSDYGISLPQDNENPGWNTKQGMELFNIF